MISFKTPMILCLSALASLSSFSKNIIAGIRPDWMTAAPNEEIYPLKTLGY
jgi:hypothetical protein